MNRIMRRAALMSGLALLSAMPAALGQESRPVARSGEGSTGSATCVLTITSGTAEMPLNYDLLEGLLESSGVLRAAAREVGIPAERLDDPDFTCAAGLDSVTSGTNHRGERSFSGVLTVHVSDEQPGAGALAERLMGAMCQRLADTLVESGRAEYARLEAQEATASHALEGAKSALDAIHEVQLQVFGSAGQSRFTPGAVLEAGRVAEGQLSELDTKLAGLRARQKALAEQVARIGQQAEKAITADPVATELEKVVKLREEELRVADASVKQGVAAQQHASDAEERLAVARAELAKQRQAASASAGGNLLADLNKEVLMLTVNIAEAEAQREFISKQIAQTREKKLLELANRYEREVEIPLPAARSAIERALRDLEDIRARVRDYRVPTVTVLGGAAPQ